MTIGTPATEAALDANEVPDYALDTFDAFAYTDDAFDALQEAAEVSLLRSSARHARSVRTESGWR